MLIIKRILDFVISFIAFVVLSPLFLVLAILIRIDSEGSIFFKQERLGKNGKTFLIYKFRTMVDNAENIGTGLFTNEDDPRITKVGRFLRKTSLDELPQLINVLKGEMSIIGPRPPVPYYPYKYNEYSEEQKLRFTVLPGITGYAQINGRNTLSWDERIEYDVEYVKKFSLLLDIKIAFKTIGYVFNKKAIYSK
ncbi:sugar transferase [Anaerosalibacter massiliensis]|uniref:sugar transferase n=1 Tax=Anaerosalibacter massiliensis TaxID=1347392 RepID=UPI000B1ADDC3|nr:sugar transferase [Anaerosalibacter massiliensis]